MEPISYSPDNQQAGRWIWFLDVVFGAIVALGIQKYEPVVKQAWELGLATFVTSLVVASCIGFFVVYDIAVYHALANKYPYRMSFLGFSRFFLDLVMAFLLYLLLVNSFQVTPEWFPILITISTWHVAAMIWHLIATNEHPQTSSHSDVSALPHLIFIGIYWLVAFLADGFSKHELQLAHDSQARTTLVVLAITILAVSAYRWQQILKKLVIA
ncbi:hypothetical protein EZV61_11440 [Corallincola luteus]|uniref:Integral membrane protein n=1 Tax=Corallincola luteus TaxID=1775177 RepID=A0ABY2AKK2_9GAMM|nr:hypothetical protein [Corallincola luteus]TCI02901.1 hypothetical protein EZV61_11440 [Corallincola luteus]